MVRLWAGGQGGSRGSAVDQCSLMQALLSPNHPTAAHPRSRPWCPRKSCRPAAPPPPPGPAHRQPGGQRQHVHSSGAPPPTSRLLKSSASTLPLLPFFYTSQQRPSTPHPPPSTHLQVHERVEVGAAAKVERLLDAPHLCTHAQRAPGSGRARRGHGAEGLARQPTSQRAGRAGQPSRRAAPVDEQEHLSAATCGRTRNPFCSHTDRWPPGAHLGRHPGRPTWCPPAPPCTVAQHARQLSCMFSVTSCPWL